MTHPLIKRLLSTSAGRASIDAALSQDAPSREADATTLSPN